MESEELFLSQLNHSSQEIDNFQAIQTRQKEQDMTQIKSVKKSTFINGLIQKIKTQFHHDWAAYWKEQKPNTFKLLYHIVLVNLLFAIFFGIYIGLMGQKQYFDEFGYFLIFSFLFLCSSLVLGTFLIDKYNYKKTSFAMIVLLIICNGYIVSYSILQKKNKLGNEFYVLIPVAFSIIILYFKGLAILYQKFESKVREHYFTAFHVLIVIGSGFYEIYNIKNHKESSSFLRQLALLIYFYLLQTWPIVSMLLINKKAVNEYLSKKQPKSQTGAISIFFEHFFQAFFNQRVYLNTQTNTYSANYLKKIEQYLIFDDYLIFFKQNSNNIRDVRIFIRFTIRIHSLLTSQQPNRFHFE